MKKIVIHKLLIFVLAALLSAGCVMDDLYNTPGGDRRVALPVSGIHPHVESTKWAKDDAIGIYMLTPGTAGIVEEADNRRYVAQTAGADVAFLPADPQHTIYYPIDGRKVDFIAYYPHRPLTNHTYLLDVTDQSNQPAIDLMTATATGHSKASPAVTFRFHHRLAKLEMTIIAGTSLTPAQLEGLEVKITNQRTAGTYKPLEDAFDIPAVAGTAITLNTAADGTRAEAILLPDNVDGNIPLPGRRFVFTLKENGRTFYWNIPDDKSFDSGDKTLYDITINRTSLTVTSDIEDWSNGGSENGSAE